MDGFVADILSNSKMEKEALFLGSLSWNSDGLFDLMGGLVTIHDCQIIMQRG
jgi:hypothetical protein